MVRWNELPVEMWHQIAYETHLTLSDIHALSLTCSWMNTTLLGDSYSADKAKSLLPLHILGVRKEWRPLRFSIQSRRVDPFDAGMVLLDAASALVKRRKKKIAKAAKLAAKQAKSNSSNHASNSNRVRRGAKKKTLAFSYKSTPSSSNPSSSNPSSLTAPSIHRSPAAQHISVSIPTTTTTSTSLADDDDDDGWTVIPSPRSLPSPSHSNPSSSHSSHPPPHPPPTPAPPPTPRWLKRLDEKIGAVVAGIAAAVRNWSFGDSHSEEEWAHGLERVGVCRMQLENSALESTLARAVLRSGWSNPWVDEKIVGVIGLFAASAGDVRVVRDVVDRVGWNTLGEGGGSMVHIACGTGKIDVVQAAIKHVALASNVSGIDSRRDSVVTNPAENGRTPLFVACMTGHTQIVTLLLDFLTRAPTKEGTRPLGVADNHGSTPLWAAAKNGHAAIVALLLERGICDPNMANTQGETPLLVATRNGSLPMMRLLLDQARVDVNTSDRLNRTPLHIACASGNLEGVALLLSRKGIQINTTSTSGMTPLRRATLSGHMDVVNALLNAGGC